MTDSGKKWLIGCSIAAFMMVLVLAAFVWGGVMLFRKAADGIEEMESTSRAVSQRFGEASDFTPDPGGEIPASRMEAFLAAREIMAPSRNELAATLANLDGSETGGGGKMRAGVRLIPRIFQFYGSRNEACLEAGIGPGEYGYYYILAYYNFLKKPVTAGPGFNLVGGAGDRGAPGTSSSEFDVREDRRENVLCAARDLALPILRNQSAALQVDAATGPWAGRLEDEIALLEADPYRLPWRDGLPQRIARSLEPYRDRLEASWNEMSNPLEIGTQLH